MRRIGIAVRVLLVIALVGLGLPAGVQAQGDNGGLVAQWHFEEGSGSVLAESSSESKGASAPGFEAAFAAAGVLLVALLIKRRR